MSFLKDHTKVRTFYNQTIKDDSHRTMSMTFRYFMSFSVASGLIDVETSLNLRTPHVKDVQEYAQTLLIKSQLATPLSGEKRQKRTESLGHKN